MKCRKRGDSTSVNNYYHSFRYQFNFKFPKETFSLRKALVIWGVSLICLSIVLLTYDNVVILSEKVIIISSHDENDDLETGRNGLKKLGEEMVEEETEEDLEYDPFDLPKVVEDSSLFESSGKRKIEISKEEQKCLNNLNVVEKDIIDEVFGDRFKTECSWWIKMIRNWKKNIDDRARIHSTIERVYANQERSGVGDRLSGVMGAFYFALQRKSRFEVRWTLFDEVFEPSCIVEGSVQRVGKSHNSSLPYMRILGSKPKVFFKNQCELGSYYSCSYKLHLSDHCYSYNRACMAKTMCRRLHGSFVNSNITMANVIGCPLRALLQPKMEFFMHEIVWFVDGKENQGTLLDLLKYMKTIKTIAIHLRMGDKYMFDSNVKGVPDSDREIVVLKNSENCASVVDRYLSATEDDGKDVKWIIASDDMRIREYFKEYHSDKILLLSGRPHHVQEIKHDSAKLKKIEQKNLFAEWLLISRADELVANKAHNFGVSAFSRSAWLYSLRSQYFEVSRKSNAEICERKEYQYHGNTITISPTCKDNVQTRIIDQPHLEFL